MEGYSLIKELLGGGLAGAMVDTILFPLDTIKTRLQSKQGLFQSGGYSKIYLGLSACLAGSIPSSAVFFTVYSYSKVLLINKSELPMFTGSTSLMNSVAASIGEAAACVVRVPAETVKQRMQSQQYHSVSKTIVDMLKFEGLRGFYRAYPATLAREIPFSCIQFPIYENLKKQVQTYYKTSQVDAPPPVWIIALCGFVAGGLASALTTPLDVLKTRIALSRAPLHRDSELPLNLFTTLSHIHRECNKDIKKTISTLFSGIVPRVIWISVGGYIFFYSYEFAQSSLSLMF